MMGGADELTTTDAGTATPDVTGAEVDAIVAVLAVIVTTGVRLPPR